MSNEFQAQLESVVRIHAHRLERYERRLIREGLSVAAKNGVPFILPSIDEDYVDVRALVDLGGVALPSLYRRTENLRTRVHIESLLLAQLGSSYSPEARF